MQSSKNMYRLAYRLIFFVVPFLISGAFWTQLTGVFAEHAPSMNGPQTFPQLFLIKDIYTRTAMSYPKDFTVMSSNLYFNAEEPSSGRELWKTDGTITGTTMIKQINATGNAFNFAEQTVLQIDGILYFIATDGVHGYELWRSDGSEEGTWMVKDINSDGDAFPPYSSPNMVAMGGSIYFAANDGLDNTELWQSDGSETGTVQIADINPIGSSYPENLPKWAVCCSLVLTVVALIESYGGVTGRR